MGRFSPPLSHSGRLPPARTRFRGIPTTSPPPNQVYRDPWVLYQIVGESMLVFINYTSISGKFNAQCAVRSCDATILQVNIHVDLSNGMSMMLAAARRVGIVRRGLRPVSAVKSRGMPRLRPKKPSACQTPPPAAARPRTAGYPARNTRMPSSASPRPEYSAKSHSDLSCPHYSSGKARFVTALLNRENGSASRPTGAANHARRCRPRSAAHRPPERSAVAGQPASSSTMLISTSALHHQPWRTAKGAEISFIGISFQDHAACALSFSAVSWAIRASSILVHIPVQELVELVERQLDAVVGHTVFRKL